VFGASLVLLYGASTAIHALRRPGGKPWLRRFDHAAIFPAHAGSYTPISARELARTMGWSLFGWSGRSRRGGDCAEGVLHGSFSPPLDNPLSFMGWIVLIADQAARGSAARSSLILLFAGGAAYSGGTLFYM